MCVDSTIALLQTRAAAAGELAHAPGAIFATARAIRARAAAQQRGSIRRFMPSRSRCAMDRAPRWPRESARGLAAGLSRVPHKTARSAHKFHLIPDRALGVRKSAAQRSGRVQTRAIAEAAPIKTLATAQPAPHTHRGRRHKVGDDVAQAQHVVGAGLCTGRGVHVRRTSGRAASTSRSGIVQWAHKHAARTWVQLRVRVGAAGNGAAHVCFALERGPSGLGCVSGGVDHGQRHQIQRLGAMCGSPGAKKLGT